MSESRCKWLKGNGARCGANRLYESDYCFWHDPARAEDAHRARQAGGSRRRREALIAGAYDLGDLSAPEGIRRDLEVARSDALQIENPTERVRALCSIDRIAVLLLKVTIEHEQLRLVRQILAREGRTE